jgi:DNA-binding MarR family transcriptional regulator
LSADGGRGAGAGPSPEPGASADPDPAPQGVGFLLGMAHRARRRAWEANLADLGLTAPQAAVLRLVAARPGSGVRHLARALGTDPMNSRRIAEALIADGLCEARHDPLDARRRPLHLSPRGQQLAGEVSRRARQDEDRVRAELGTRRYGQLLEMLRVLAATEQSGGDT